MADGGSVVVGGMNASGASGSSVTVNTPTAGLIPNGASVERELGFGEREPIASNNTAAGMAKNRRVEVLCKKG